jgi:hypothetical protein
MYVTGGFDGQKRNDIYRIKICSVKLESKTDSIKQIESDPNLI